MSESNESGSSSRRNPLIWISLAVIGLILFVFLSGDRGDSMPIRSDEAAAAVKTTFTDETELTVKTAFTDETELTDETAFTDEPTGTIERIVLLPPGMRARQYLEQLRAEGQPYPLELVYEKAQGYLQEGSLADAHLLYFFAAREDYLPAMMKMGQMSDPTLFQAENSLLDDADVIQAYKWYRQAAEMGHQPASERVVSLRQWAQDEAGKGNSHARQLLLNFE
jgi:TPR repeat protein